MASVPDLPTYKFIDITLSPRNKESPLEKAICIGRAPQKNSSRTADEKNNIYIRNPVISATHIELYKAYDRFFFLLNKSKNGFFLIDEYDGNVSFVGGEDESTQLKNGNIIGMCFSKNFLQDYKEGSPENHSVEEALKQCKILVQIFTDYDQTLVAKVYNVIDHVKGIQAQLDELVQEIGSECFKKSGMHPVAIEDIINLSSLQYVYDDDAAEISRQKKMYYTAYDNSYDDFFDEYSDSNYDSEAGTNSDPEEHTSFGFILNEEDKESEKESEQDDDLGDEDLEEDGEGEQDEGDEEEAEDEEDEDEKDVEEAKEFEKDEKPFQSIIISDDKFSLDSSVFSSCSLKRTFDESNCSDFDDEVGRATEDKLHQMTELCEFQSKEIEHLSEEVRRLKRFKSQTKAALIGAAGGAAATLTALYQIGSRMNL